MKLPAEGSALVNSATVKASRKHGHTRGHDRQRGRDAGGHGDHPEGEVEVFPQPDVGDGRGREVRRTQLAGLQTRRRFGAIHTLQSTDGTSHGDVRERRVTSGLRRGLGLPGQEAMAVDDRRGEVDELAVIDTGLLAQHLECARLVDAVALHEDPLGSLGQRAAPECALEILILGEAPEHDVDRALPILDVGVADVREYAALGRLA